MSDCNIFIVFANEGVAVKTAKMLLKDGIKPICVCSSGMEIKRRISYYQNGIIICGYKLKDCSVIQLAEDIPKNFSIIMIGSASQVDLCNNDKIFKLGVPLKKDDITCTISMLINFAEKKRIKRTDAENETIYKAKTFLIDKYGMTEEQAYKYIRKKSMDMGVKITHMAEIINRKTSL